MTADLRKTLTSGVAELGLDLRRELRAWVEGTADLPLARLFAPLGIELNLTAADPGPVMGVRWSSAGQDLRIATALSDGADKLNAAARRISFGSSLAVGRAVGQAEAAVQPERRAGLHLLDRGQPLGTGRFEQVLEGTAETDAAVDAHGRWRGGNVRRGMT